MLPRIRLASSLPPTSPRHPRRRFRPEVSALEGRALLSTFTVQNLNDSGPGSLRAAIAQAEGTTGTNLVAFTRGLTGTIDLGSPLVISGNLKIHGPGASVISLNGQVATQDVVVDAGVTASISGLTLTGGFGVTGGGLQNDGKLTLANMAFRGNQAGDGGNVPGDVTGSGGGIYNAAGATLVVSSSQFTKNRASNSRGGGGIYNAGTLTLSTSKCSGNLVMDPFVGSGYMGDSLYNAATATVDLCTFTADVFNSIDSSGNLTIRQSSVSGDSTVGIITYGTATIDSCSVSGNGSSFAGTFGGGIQAKGNLTLVNSTIADNKGVGLTIYRGSSATHLPTAVSIVLCTIADNTVPTMPGDVTTGAGIDVQNAGGYTQISLHDTIVAGNELAPSGGGTPVLHDLYTGTTITILTKPPQYISLGYNLIQAPGSVTFTGTTVGNIYGVNPMLGPLANNGGPTQTMALETGSPAINAGDPDTAGLPATDQRGLPRVVGGRVDIGAFEVQ
jgi:hypothetical protein